MNMLMLVFVLGVFVPLFDAAALRRKRQLPELDNFFSLMGVNRRPNIFYPGDWDPYYSTFQHSPLVRVMPALTNGRVEPIPRFSNVAFSPVFQPNGGQQPQLGNLHLANKDPLEFEQNPGIQAVGFDRNSGAARGAVAAPPPNAPLAGRNPWMGSDLSPYSNTVSLGSQTNIGGNLGISDGLGNEFSPLPPGAINIGTSDSFGLGRR